MKGVILAGGFGTRLRPLTFTKPKPMVPLVDKPVIEHVVDYLVSHGLSDIVITTTYLRQLIIDHLEYREDVRLSYPLEPRPLGTAGSVKNAGLGEEGEPFVVIQGDNITDADLRAMVEFHYDTGAMITIALTPVEEPWHYGIAELDEDGYIKRFREKPSRNECFSNLASTGIYVVEPSALDYVPEGAEFDFARDLFPVIHAKLAGKIAGYQLDEANFWADVGQPEGYMSAMAWLLRKMNRDVFAGSNTEINSSGIRGPAVIGDCVIVEEGCSVGPNAVLFEDVYVARNSCLEECMIGEKTIMGRNALVKQAIIGARCELGNDVEVCGGKIWPFVSIPHRTTVDSTIKRFVKLDGTNNSHELLRTVPEEEAFYFNMRSGGRIVHTGLVANSVERFVEILKTVDQRSIEYHLRDGQNDFARWIREIFGDEQLANELMARYMTRNELAAVIDARIKELKMEEVPMICQ